MFAVIRNHFKTRTQGRWGMGERDAEVFPIRGYYHTKMGQASAYPIAPLETAC
ncbi:MAG: hypothetical protein AB4372_22000 [Xenococcus sp. (in: cyanobacteria)]